MRPNACLRVRLGKMLCFSNGLPSRDRKGAFAHVIFSHTRQQGSNPVVGELVHEAEPPQRRCRLVFLKRRDGGLLASMLERDTIGRIHELEGRAQRREV
jgi:hypothetical protein